MPPRNLRELIKFIGTEEDEPHERMERIWSIREMNARVREDNRLKFNDIMAPDVTRQMYKNASGNPKK